MLLRQGSVKSTTDRETGKGRGQQWSRTVQLLTRRAMAVFRVQWLLPAQLVLHLPAMATGVVSGFEVGIVVVDLVRCTEFPLVMLSIELAMITIVAVFARIIVLDSLGGGSHVETKLGETTQRD